MLSILHVTFHFKPSKSLCCPCLLAEPRCCFWVGVCGSASGLQPLRRDPVGGHEGLTWAARSFWEAFLLWQVAVTRTLGHLLPFCLDTCDDDSRARRLGQGGLGLGHDRKPACWGWFSEPQERIPCFDSTAEHLSPASNCSASKLLVLCLSHAGQAF